MKLSENFTLEELTATNTGLPNEPDERTREKLLYLANYILQPLRDRWGAIIITSGYRSSVVNSHIGGSPSSQHLKGEACDFQTPDADLKEVFTWLVEDSRFAFGQAIYERKGSVWIHISLPRLNGANGLALTYDGIGYSEYRTGRL